MFEYLFAVEADKKPIFNIDEWEKLQNITNDLKLAEDPSVVAYGQVDDAIYIELYERV